MKIRTKTLPDRTTQIGYYTEKREWVGLANLYRKTGGWVSDNYAGWHRTIREWKLRLTLNQA